MTALSLAILLACQADWDARLLYEKGVSEGLRLSEGAIELDRGELFEDDGPAAGYSYKPNEEALSGAVRIRKELVVPKAAAKQAVLLVGPGGTLEARINGQAAALEKLPMQGRYWQAYGFDPRLLVAGKNEIVLGGSGKIWIARDDEFPAGSRPPNRSAKSSDGGKSWDDRRLGASGEIDGEYYVRVFLDRHRPEGWLLLPVLDALNLEGKPVGPAGSVTSVRVEVRGEGAIRTRMRSGPVAAPDATWTDWSEPAAAKSRFIQIRLELSTADPLVTPRLKGLKVEAKTSIEGDWTGGLKVLEDRNGEITRTSIPFRYEPFGHPRLKAFREQHKLDDVVQGAKGEFELIARLARWSSGLWERGHLKEIYPYWDALEILKKHPDGTPIGGFCQQYNVVFLQACESFGLAGRAVSISAGRWEDRLKGGGHEVVEIWSNEHRKWVYVDGNAAWSLVDENSGTPLSLWELRERQIKAMAGEPFPPVAAQELAKTRYVWKGLAHWPPFIELRLIPRSNFLEEPSPLPLNQGMRGWFWTGHHAWDDETVPASWLYGHRVRRRGNFEWTLNQARYVLEAKPVRGEIRVHLETETPGFDTFLADINGEGRRPTSAVFLWKLSRGVNTLEVCPRNSAGREGIPSSIRLEY